MAGWYENHPDGTTPIQRIMRADRDAADEARRQPLAHTYARNRAMKEVIRVGCEVTGLGSLRGDYRIIWPAK